MITEFLYNQVLEYYNSKVLGTNDGSEVKILIPALTVEIGMELNEKFHANNPNIRCFYITSKSSNIPVDSSKGIITPDGATKQREGSFIQICEPGVLSQMPESIKGSGGTIKATLFNEEWPWVQDSYDEFDFQKLFLPKYIEYIGNDLDNDEINKIAGLFASKGGILESLTSENALIKNKILFEDYLQRIVPQNNEKLNLENVLKAIGLPICDLDEINSYLSVLGNLAKNVKKQLLKRYPIEDILKNATSIEELVALTDYQDIIEEFHLRLTTTKFNSEIILLFTDALSNNKNWSIFTIEVIRTLYGISDKKIDSPRPKNTYLILDKISSSNGLFTHSEKKDKIVCFEGMDLCFHFELKSDRPGSEFRIKVNNDKSIVYFDEANKASHTIPNINFKSYNFKLEQQTNGEWIDTGLETKSTLTICNKKSPTIIVVKEHKKVFKTFKPLKETDYSEELEKKIELDHSADIQIFQYINNLDQWYLIDRPFSIKDREPNNNQDPKELKFSNSNFGRTSESVIYDVTVYPNNRLTLTCFSNNNIIWLQLTANIEEKGNYTIHEEFRFRIFNSTKNREPVRQLMNCFESPNQLYRGLKGRSSQTDKRAILGNIAANEDGYLPILINTSQAFNEKRKESKSFIKFGDWAEPAAIEGNDIDKSLAILIEQYKSVRNNLIKMVRENIQIGSGLGLKQRPLGSANFLFNIENKQNIEDIIVSYLEIYYELLRYQKFEALAFSDKYFTRYLDNIVLYKQSKDNSEINRVASLLGPWHPLVVAKKYLLESNFYKIGKKILKDSFKNDSHKLIVFFNHTTINRWFALVNGVGYLSGCNDDSYLFCWDIIQQDNINILNDLQDYLNESFDISFDLVPVFEESRLSTYLKNYHKAFPEKRTITVELPINYDLKKVYEDLESFLYQEENGYSMADILVGGIHVFIDDKIQELEATFQTSPICFYKMTEEERRSNDLYIDIKILNIGQEYSFSQPRFKKNQSKGKGDNIIITQPFHDLEEDCIYRLKTIPNFS